MSSSSSDCVVQTGKLVVLVAENGHFLELDCDECTLVEALQRKLESVTGIPFNDQLLLCLDMKLELQRSLSAYKLPSNDREVFLFNKARMRRNTPPPTIEQVPIIDIHDPPFPSSNNNPHPIDEATDPALKALPSYERQFMYHFQYGDAIYRCTIDKFDICERLLREQKVQERALEIARGNLDHFYKMILQTYMNFMKCFSQQHRSHNSLLVNFGRDIEKLRSIKLLPALQMANRRCLLDFVKEKNLWKMVEDCNSSHRQFEKKVSEFKQEFGELKHNVERLFSSKASFTKELALTMKDHQRFINEQKSIMQALSKDVNTVKKLVDDCLSSQFSSSLRPHDAVSALGPMYDSHDSNYIPNMQACDRAISSFLDFCQDKKNEMNSFVHSYMQKIAYIQYTIKDVRYKFSVFQEALKCQNDQFDPLKVVRGIGPAYRACLAEVVRRKAAMKLYMGMAGQLAEKLATKRECEVKRREEFLKVHSRYIPRDVLASMGLYDTPNQCDINIAPFDTNLLDIDLSDLDRYAPESLLGLASKREKHGTPKSSLSMYNDGSHSAEVEGSAMPLSEKYYSEELLEGSDLVEIAGTSKMEVENAKLKAELASKIALICSISPDLDYESLDDSKIDIILKNAAEKTSEALNQKDEYIKHLKTTLKMKQIQCESYERRIQELEQRLSNQYSQGRKPSFDEEISNFVISTVQSENNRSEVLGAEEAHMPHTMEDVSCASSSSKSELLSKQDKVREGLDVSMTDSSSILSPHLDSSMMDPRRDEEHLCKKDENETLFSDGDRALTRSSMALSMSQPVGDLCDKAVQPCLDAKASNDLQELQSALAEKSNQLADAETKLQMLTEEVSKLGKELEISRKLLDESQMNCAHLENCLHEAREEAQTHLCAADRQASEYSALRASAIKTHSLFERLRSCVSSAGVVAFADSLHALAQSLANSSNGNDKDSTGEFRECIRVLADKVSLLSRHRAELLDSYTKAEAEIELLKKEVEDKKESVNTLYLKHQLEKQANKEKISFARFEVHEIAAFVLNSAGHYEAINRNRPHYYLSAESVALFAAHLPSQPSYIVGQIVHMERQTVKSTTLDGAENDRDPVDLLTSDTGTSGNPYGLPLGCEYFVVTVAMLPDTTIHLSPTS